MSGPKTSFVLFLAGVFLFGCSAGQPNGCPLPPREFSDASLVGTWSAIGSRGDNAITLRADGKYKQVIRVWWQKFSYESDWLPWRVTYSEKGLPYLHLQGLLMCAYWDQVDCRTGNTGIEPNMVGGTKDIWGNTTYWYDFCNDDWVETPGEGVLIVLGEDAAFEQPPRGVTLIPLSKSDMPTGPTFQFREP